MIQCVDQDEGIECDSHCGCTQFCNNRQLQSIDYERLRNQITVQQVYGLDSFTKKNLLYLLPCDLSLDQKVEILGEILLVINQMKTDAWNCTLIFLCAIQRLKELRDSPHAERHREKSLLSFEQKIGAYQQLYMFSIFAEFREALRISCKGLGVICTNKNGIKANQIISPYYGEVYPAWLWHI